MGEIFLIQMLSLPHSHHSGQGQGQTDNNDLLVFLQRVGVGEEDSHRSRHGLPVGIHKTALLRHKSHTLQFTQYYVHIFQPGLYFNPGKGCTSLGGGEMPGVL